MTDLEAGLTFATVVLLVTHYVQSLKYDRDRGNWQRMLDRAATREGLRIEKLEPVDRVDAVDFLDGALPFRPFRPVALTKAEVEKLLAGAESNAGLAAVMQVLEEWLAKLNMEGHAGNELSRGGYVGVMRVYEELRGKMTKSE